MGCKKKRLMVTLVDMSRVCSVLKLVHGSDERRGVSADSHVTEADQDVEGC